MVRRTVFIPTERPECCRSGHGTLRSQRDGNRVDDPSTIGNTEHRAGPPAAARADLAGRDAGLAAAALCADATGRARSVVPGPAPPAVRSRRERVETIRT
jgi:hypothetical protein